jgi:four helix bundle protein
MALRVSAQLPRQSGGRHIANQLVRSGTTCGAIYEEARAAESRADFVHKVRLAAKEVRESLYWIQLIQKVKLVPFCLDDFGREADELAAILVASAQTAARRLDPVRS